MYYGINTSSITCITQFDPNTSAWMIAFPFTVPDGSISIIAQFAVVHITELSSPMISCEV